MFFDYLLGKKFIEKLNPDCVLSLQNIITFGLRCPQFVFVHQAIPFQKIKKFSFFRSEERKLAIYQYLINSDDSKVLEYLKVFTFLSRQQIEEVYAQHQQAPEKRIAQKTLAWEIVKDLHGQAEADNAVQVSEKLFAGNFEGLSVRDILTGMKGVPTFKYENELSLVDLLVNNKIASSKREAREFIKGNAISINGKIFNDETQIITKDLALENKVIIIRRGKKKYFLAEV